MHRYNFVGVGSARMFGSWPLFSFHTPPLTSLSTTILTLTMFSRSIVGSFRQAAARPAVMARPAVARAVAVRGYSDAAEAKDEKKAEEGQSDEAKKIAELEEKLKESTVSSCV